MWGTESEGQPLPVGAAPALGGGQQEPGQPGQGQVLPQGSAEAALRLPRRRKSQADIQDEVGELGPWRPLPCWSCCAR